MPARTRAARPSRQAPAPEPEETTASLNGDKDYTVYADKPITPTMQAFHEWLEDVTGIELDERSVSLGGSLRMDFQRSDFWAEDDRNRRNKVAEPEPDEDEEEEAQPRRRSGKSTKASAPAPAKPSRRRRAEPEPEPPEDEEDEEDEDIEDEPEEETEPEPEPAPRSRRTSGRAVKTSAGTDGPAPRSGRRRGGKAAAATPDEGKGTPAPY